MSEVSLDPAQGPTQQPVEDVEQFVASDRTEFEEGAEAASGRLRRAAPRRVRLSRLGPG